MKTAPAIEDRTAIVDEFGDLAKTIKLFKPTADRHAELRDKIAAWYDASPAAEAFTAHGKHWDVQILARAHVRVISSMSKLQRFLGLKKFLTLCSFSLKNVEDYVTIDDRAKFLSESQTGHRTVKAVAKVAQA